MNLKTFAVAGSDWLSFLCEGVISDGEIDRIKLVSYEIHGCVQITREKCPRMRDKIGCRDDFDRNLQIFSESFRNSNMIRNTMGKHQHDFKNIMESQDGFPLLY